MVVCGWAREAEKTRDGREAEVGNSKSLFFVPLWRPSTFGSPLLGVDVCEYMLRFLSDRVWA